MKKNVKMKTKEILSEVEQDCAIRYYEYGWSLQEITDRILSDRANLIRRDLLRETGTLISKRFNRQMYPIEFYGKV